MTIAFDAAASMMSDSVTLPVPAAQHLDPQPLLLEALKRRRERLDRALDVGLDDEVEILDLARLHPAEDVLERDLAGRRRRRARLPAG